MKKLFLLFFALCSSLCASAQFTGVWKTDNAGVSESNQIMLPVRGKDYLIEWQKIGNPTVTGSMLVAGESNNYVLTLPEVGSYEISLEKGSGELAFFRFSNSSDRLKLLEIKQWGTNRWTNLDGAFYGCQNLTITATDIPDLSGLTSISQMFADCGALTTVPNIGQWNMSTITRMQSTFAGATLFNDAINDWDVSNVTDMYSMFSDTEKFDQPLNDWDIRNVSRVNNMFAHAKAFNHPLDQWNVSNVREMSIMFYGASSFNQSLNSWNVSNVESIFGMFLGASSFNQPLNDWDIRKVTSLGGMFNKASEFNQPLDQWDVSNVTDMSGMFEEARNFNQPLEMWNVSKVTDMSDMFMNASSFNQSLSAWDVSKVKTFNQAFKGTSAFNHSLGSWNIKSATNLEYMLVWSGMDCISFTSTLNGWAANTLIPSNLRLHADNIRYSAAANEALEYLRNTKGWAIVTGVIDECAAIGNFVTLWKTDNPGVSANNEVIIPIDGTDYNITWEKVGNPAINVSAIVAGATTSHRLSFPEPGVYKVTVSKGTGVVRSIRFNNEADRLKLLEIANWSNIPWSNLDAAFYGCSNLEVTAEDMPDLRGVTSFNNLFRGCSSLTTINGIGLWNVANVTSMNGAFYQAAVFNSSLEFWNVSNVISMEGMFKEATAFNKPLNSWNVSNVLNMKEVFNNAVSFNQPLASWNVGNVTTMEAMFAGASVFNQPLSSWNVSSVTSLRRMFEQASRFNQSLLGWNVSKVTDMRALLKQSTSFNQRLDDWSIPVVEYLDEMLDQSAIDCGNITRLLKNWAYSSLTPANLTLGALGISYGPQANDALLRLRNDKNWTITIEGEVVCTQLDGFMTIWKTDNEGTSASNQVTLPITGQDYTIDWEYVNDPSLSGSILVPGSTTSYTITFPQAGNYRINAISDKGSISNIQFNNEADKLKILEITKWGSITWTTMHAAFSGCSNLQVSATDHPDLSIVSTTESMFRNCSAIVSIPGINDWDVSNVNTMAYMFYRASNFNSLINNWKVDDLQNMSYLFYDAYMFNQPLNNWSTSNVNDMQYAFSGAVAFNQSIDNWDVSHVVNMEGLFQRATVFNQPIGSWKLTNVENIDRMFDRATAFNQDINSWQFPLVTSLNRIFASASAFNKPLNNWNVANIITMGQMFVNALSFDQPIDNWNVYNVTSMNNMFDGAAKFNQSLNNWNMSNVIEIEAMFAAATAFNQPINLWDLSNVSSMSYMFYGASSFNQPINSWDVKNVTYMTAMFKDASSFNKSLSNWNLSNVENIDEMLDDSGIDCNVISQTLGGWAKNTNTPMSLELGASGIDYSENTVGAINFLRNTKNWIINIGVQTECPEADSFITMWKTDNTGTSNSNQITMPIIGSDYKITWVKTDNPSLADTVTVEGATTSYTLTLPEVGTYEVSISKGTGTLSAIRFNNQGDRAKLVEISNWGSNLWTSMESAFYGCNQLTVSAYDRPNLTIVTSTENMFRGCSSLSEIPELTTWNVGTITTMKAMFMGATTFNSSVSAWDVSKVTSMTNLFTNAYVFDQNLALWNLNAVTEMNAMLQNSGLNCANITRTLQGWATNTTTPSNLYLGALGIDYANQASTAITLLENEKGWTIDIGRPVICRELEAFITVWNTNLDPSNEDYEILLPVIGTNFEIYWEEIGRPTVNGTTIVSESDGNLLFPFPQKGNYKVYINKGSGTLESFNFMNTDGQLDLLEVTNWGLNEWSTLQGAFSDCQNLTISAEDILNMSNITNTDYMFLGCKNISKIPNINLWDMSNVVSMLGMFGYTSKFNEPLNKWDVGRVENMNSMFLLNGVFNQPLADWDVRNVTNMDYMFFLASSFNQSLGDWQLNSITTLSNIFESSGLDCASTTHTLTGWTANPSLPSAITFDASTLNYAPQATVSLGKLRDEKQWNILMGSEVACAALPVTLVEFNVRSQEDKIILDWATTSETDHDYFEVQRSHDGLNWEVFTKLNGKGNTTVTQNYTATDITPFVGTSYYRLKIVDLDQTFSYSLIRAVDTMKVLSRFLYPNPTRGLVNFFNMQEDEVVIYNSLGQQVRQIYITPQSSSVSLDALPTGTYIFKMGNGWQSTVIKIP